MKNLATSLFTRVNWFFFLALDEGGGSSNIVLSQFTKGLLSKSAYITKIFFNFKDLHLRMSYSKGQPWSTFIGHSHTT